MKEKTEKKEPLTKSKARVKELGEVFTPAALVSEMLDKLPPDCWLPEKTFLEPSCGTGNFLVQALERKLARGHPPLQALATIYGVDIMKDNVKGCEDPEAEYKTRQYSRTTTGRNLDDAFADLMT
jgi:type I restriction-modification system DNA methylase subunit